MKKPINKYEDIRNKLSAIAIAASFVVPTAGFYLDKDKDTETDHVLDNSVFENKELNIGFLNQLEIARIEGAYPKMAVNGKHEFVRVGTRRVVKLYLIHATQYVDVDSLEAITELEVGQDVLFDNNGMTVYHFGQNPEYIDLSEKTLSFRL